MQGVGRVGYLRDPDDNVFGLISPVMSDGSTGDGVERFVARPERTPCASLSDADARLTSCCSTSS